MMTFKRYFTISLLIFASAGSVIAKIDLATLPTRDTVQLTIYNSADLTLARESRALTLKKGLNELQFSWANTLIDPTSLEMMPLKNADKIDIFDLTFPPRVKNLGLWNVQSEVSGTVPVEISYLTSGLSWRAFYMGTLSDDEKTMRLQGYVRVQNNSGEDYENAQTRLIVGKVNIIEPIVSLAKREYPYSRLMDEIRKGRSNNLGSMRHGMIGGMGMPGMGGMGGMGGGTGGEMGGYWYDNGKIPEPKAVKKEGLSEYFLYTIEGTETIHNGWAKRLGSFDIEDIPVVNLYKYEEEMYGVGRTIRFLSFKNDEEHELGDTPIPGGAMKVYRNIDSDSHLSYEGQSSFKYIPIDEKVELNLGAVSNVVAAPTLMDYKTKNYRFNDNHDIKGWDEIRDFKVTVKNTRDVAIKVEIKRNFKTIYWAIEKDGPFDKYEKVDKDTVKFTLELEPQSEEVFHYTLTTYHGTRCEEVME
ncbi:MAG: DUF4139 domain-containing protein [Phycisphaerae bacterium]|nr:DUF4139 domain-containing protein [Phycisphaerae bacterium]